MVAQALKGTLDAPAVRAALHRAALAAGVEPIVVTGSDGGDGLLDAVSLVDEAVYPASDPLLRPIDVRVGWLDGETAVVESRLACGLSLLGEAERRPLQTSTRGVGELIDRMAREGARRVVVGLGGSATMDGGVGMARAWGWIPRDAGGRELAPGGGSLVQLAGFDRGAAPAVDLVGLTDVANVLTGTDGARVYAAQKGASPEAEERLAAGLERLAEVAAALAPAQPVALPGAGAAGGLGFGLVFFGGARLEPGAEWVLQRVGFADALAGAALLVTVEGAFDRTSLAGKLTGAVIGAGEDAGVPVLLLAPRATHVPPGVELETGGGIWSAADLEAHAERGIRRVLRLSQP
ncbi:MAG: glycerate kinase [Gemmatimonadales bacterium]